MSIHTVLAPFTLKGFYLLTWGSALGTNVWQSISAFKSFGALPSETYTHLQDELSPVYAATSAGLAGTLLATHLYFHPVLITNLGRAPHWWQIEEGVQGLLILTALVPQVINLCGIQRAIGQVRKEKAESKSEALTQRDAGLHRCSAALNFISFVGLVGLGLAVSM